jgi:hypothetical protein
MYEGIIIHHSATRDSASKSWSAIRDYHIHTNGWRDIGYHFGVERIGDQYQILGGRPLSEMGAHTAGHNNTIGICLVGDFDEQAPADEAMQLLFRLILGLMIAYGFKPEQVRFHSDYSEKSCPGRYFPKRELIAKLRNVHYLLKGGT